MTTSGACEQRSVLCLLAAAKDPMPIPAIAEFMGIASPNAVRDALAACAETARVDGGCADVEAFGFRGPDVRDPFVAANEADVAAASRLIAQRCRDWRSLQSPLSRRYAFRYAGDHLCGTQDFDALWDLCRDEEFREQQITVSCGYEWTINLLTHAVRLHAAREDAPDQPYRLAWLLVQLGETDFETQTDLAGPLARLHGTDVDSEARISDTLKMLKGDGEPLLLRAACLLHSEITLQSERKDAPPSGAGLSFILREIVKRLPEPKKDATYENAVGDVGFLGPLAVSLAGLVPDAEITAFLCHCHSDSLVDICKHLCVAAKGLPPDKAKQCLGLALAIGSKINWVFRFRDPIDDICDAAAKKGLLMDVLAVADRLPSEIARSFRCKAALAAYSGTASGTDPVELIREVEDIQTRDETLDTLACRMIHRQDLAGALRAVRYVVSVDACQASLLQAIRICASDSDRDAVMGYVKKMRKGEGAAEILVEAAETVQEKNPKLAAQFLREALDRARKPSDPHDGVLQIAAVAKAMHDLGLARETDRALDDAVKRCGSLKEDWEHDYALGRIAEVFAETGRTRRILKIVAKWRDAKEVADMVSDIAPICAENRDSASFAEILESCVKGLRLSRENRPEEDIASALKAFADGPDRADMFATVEKQARAGNLVATMALARITGEEGRIADALTMLRNMDVKPPPALSGVAGTNIPEKHINRMMSSFANVLGKRSKSQSMFELLENAYQAAGGDGMLDELEPTPEDEERNAVPQKTIALVQSLLGVAVAHGDAQVLDDLISLLMESARAIPRTALRSSDTLAADAIKETAKQLAKLGQADRACRLAGTISSEGDRNESLKEISETLLECGKLDEARRVLETIADAGVQDFARVSVAKSLASQDAPAAIHELSHVRNQKTRALGLRVTANILVKPGLAGASYEDLLRQVASACTRTSVAHEIPDWCFFTMPLALAVAGKASDIPRFLDLVSPDNDRRGELTTHGMAEGIDVLIENGHIGGLDDLIAALPEEDIRDGRRHHLALFLGRTGGAEAAGPVVAAIEGGNARARTQRELVDALLEANKTKDAMQVALSIDADARHDMHYDRDDALKAVVRHCLDSGDGSGALEARDHVTRPWYKLWAMAFFAQDLLRRGKTDLGRRMLESILSIPAEAQDGSLLVAFIRFFCTDCGAQMDVGLFSKNLQRVADPEERAEASAHLAGLCCSRGEKDRAFDILQAAEAYAREHDGSKESKGALARVVAAYVACGRTDAAQSMVESIDDVTTKDHLLGELDVAMAKSPGKLDDSGQVTLTSWSEMVGVVDRIESRGRKIEACRRLLDLPSVRASPGCRDHLVRLALRAYKELNQGIRHGLRERLINTLVMCGSPNEAASLLKYDPGESGNLPFLRATDELAGQIGGSDAPHDWIRFLGAIDIPDRDARTAVLQQAVYHLCRRRKGHLLAIEELLRLIRASGLSPADLSTTYVHWHMAVSMLGAEALPYLMSTLPDMAIDQHVATSAVFAIMAILIRSGRYAEAQRIAEDCPPLGLTGVFRG